MMTKTEKAEVCVIDGDYEYKWFLVLDEDNEFYWIWGRTRVNP